MLAHTNPTHWSVSLGVVGVCLSLMACKPSNQVANPTPVHPAAALSPAAPVSSVTAGGWSQADANADDVQEAARFAVQAYAVAQHSRTLYKDVIEVQQQVVAGMNFKLKLQVLHNGQTRNAQVTVWRQLNGQYQLTDWAWSD